MIQAVLFWRLARFRLEGFAEQAEMMKADGLGDA